MLLTCIYAAVQSECDIYRQPVCTHCTLREGEAGIQLSFVFYTQLPSDKDSFGSELKEQIPPGSLSTKFFTTVFCYETTQNCPVCHCPLCTK